MTRHRITAHRGTARRSSVPVSFCLALLLGVACAPSPAEPEPRDAMALAAPPEAESETAASDPASGGEVGAVSSGAASSPAASAAAGGLPESSSASSAPDPDTSVPASGAPARPSSGEPMTDFFGIGRGDRVADLGGISGYSLAPVRRVLGPAGVLYVRRSTPPPSEPSTASAADDLAPVTWMNTTDDAPLIAEATRLNAVTLLYGYHAVIAAGHDRKKLNAAVYRALVPGGLYIIAENVAPPGSGLAAARQLNAIEDSVVRMEVQAAGFDFVEAADFVSSVAGASERSPGGQYVLKFTKPK